MAEEPKRLPGALIAVTVILAGAYIALRFAAPQLFDPKTPAEAVGETASEVPEATEEPVRRTPGLFTADERRARAEREETVTLETPGFLATFSNLNTGLRSLRIRGERFETEEGQPLELVKTDREEYFPYRIWLDGVDIPEDAVFEAEQVSPTSARFRYEGDDFVVVRKLEAGQSPYQIWSTVTVHNRAPSSRSVGLSETIHHYVTREEEDEGSAFLGLGRPSLGKSTRGICVAEEGSVREGRGDLLPPETLSGGVHFAGIENTYFSLALAAPGSRIDECLLRAEDRPDAVNPHGSLFEISLALSRQAVDPGQSITFRTMAYAGPKDIDALAAAGNELSEVLDLGWFSFVARGLIRLLRFIYEHVGNWGVAIILLTFLVKLLLYPLTEKSFQSMAKMRLLKPEMDRINELYGDDREKKGAAIMELYKKHQINPLAGCLPSLLQMPIWVALYQSLSTNIELYHAPFVGYWTDLSSPDSYLVLPLIVGLLMFVQQRMTPSTMDPMQAKIMMYMMPTMITAFMLFLPAGLCLYMVTNSTLGIGQQRWIQWRLDRKTPTEATSENEPSTIEESDDSPGGGSSSVVSTRRTAGAKKRSHRGRA